MAVPIDSLPDERPLGCLIRLIWIFLGNALLVGLAVVLAQPSPNFLDYHDAAYGLTVLALIVLRYLDIRWWSRLSAQARQANLLHWRHYVLALLIVAAILWMSAHAVRYHIIPLLAPEP
jgi:hypothetical protein